MLGVLTPATRDTTWPVSVLHSNGVAISLLNGYPFTACSTLNTVSLGLKFGGQTYVFSGIDLILEDLSTSTPSLAGFCLSSLFILGNALDSGIVGTSGPAWVVGVAFLKNVYSVYRSVDAPLIHDLLTTPRLFKFVPGMRPRWQEQSPVQSALLDLAVWTVVSQRTARRCTRLQHLLQPSTYHLASVPLAVALRSRTHFLITAVEIGALVDCSRDARSTVSLWLVFRFCCHWCDEFGPYVEQLYVVCPPLCSLSRGFIVSHGTFC